MAIPIDERLARILADRTAERQMAESVALALEIMLNLRDQCVYHGVGWLLLNSACCRLADRFEYGRHLRDLWKDSYE